MKRILLQDKSLSLSALDSYRDIVQGDLAPLIFEMDITHCLAKPPSPIDTYQLIITHPHTADAYKCCIQSIEKATKAGIPVILIYGEYSITDKIHAIAQDLNLETKLSEMGTRRQVYAMCIRKYLTD